MRQAKEGVGLQLGRHARYVPQNLVLNGKKCLMLSNCAGTRPGRGAAGEFRSLQGALPGRHDQLGRSSETARSRILLSPGDQRSASTRLGTSPLRFGVTMSNPQAPLSSVMTQVVSDARRMSDLRWFWANFPQQTRCVRVESREETRRRRGWIFTPGTSGHAPV